MSEGQTQISHTQAFCYALIAFVVFWASVAALQTIAMYRQIEAMQHLSHADNLIEAYNNSDHNRDTVYTPADHPYHGRSGIEPQLKRNKK